MPQLQAEKSDIAGGERLDLKLAHSPDSDDAFMFYAMATRKIPTGNLQFTHVLEDIQTLNQKAAESVYDITAVSFHAYAYLADRYVLLPCGASFGDGYGPIVVARAGGNLETIKGKRVAVPGKLTTAYLALQLYESDFEPVFVPFDQIAGAVVKGEVEAGVVIHESQLTYAREGLRKVVDLGEWWRDRTKLPLPLGGNAARRSLGRDVLQQTASLIRRSIQYGFDHREEALNYAKQFGRGLDTSTADRFVSMYVNDWTVDYGERGRLAVAALLDRGYEKGLLPRRVTPEFVD